MAPGGQLVYDLGFTNKGAAVATAAELRLPLPAGTTFVSATDGGTLSGGDVVWALGTIPISTGAKRRATVTVDGGLPDGALLVVDAASVTATISAQTQQSRAMAMTRVEAATTLELALEVDPDPVEPGQLLDLRARISNTSNSATGALTLRLHYPDLLYQFPVATGGAVCPGGQCLATELLTWNLTALPAHGSHTVSLGTFVNGNAPNGSLIPFEFELFEDGAPAGAAGHTVEVRATSPLELSITATPDPVAPGAQVVYELSYGNDGASPATSTVLRMPMPAGTTLVGIESGTGELSQDGNEIVWQLGAVAAKGAGRERVTVLVDNGLADGSLLEIDAASFTGVVNTVTHQARATNATRVHAGTILSLQVTATPDPVQPLQELNVGITVHNETGSPTGTVLVRLHYPEHMNQFPTVVGGALCPGGQCTASEILEWNLGALGPNATVMVSMQENVLNGVSNGTLIPFQVDVLESGVVIRRETETVVVYPFTDGDGDGTSDLDDLDDDNDGMPDAWEILHCLNPFSAADAAQDPDEDGATNLQEFLAGTDPFCDGTPEECEGFVCNPFATLDIDADGSVLPLTDGLLILRHLFGFTGSTLVTGAVGGACTRCTAGDIQAYLGVDRRAAQRRRQRRDAAAHRWIVDPALPVRVQWLDADHGSGRRRLHTLHVRTTSSTTWRDSREVMDDKRAMLVHFLAALAYRTQKALRGAPAVVRRVRGRQPGPHSEVAGAAHGQRARLRADLLRGRGAELSRPLRSPRSTAEIHRFHGKLEALARPPARRNARCARRRRSSCCRVRSPTP